MTPQHTKSCGSHPDSKHYHQPCSCSALNKEMKREIKFRAWDKNDKIFQDDFVVKDGKAFLSIYDGGYYKLTETNWILQQYTGLHDKNGKEIYTDDILLVKKGNTEFLATPQFSLAYMGYALCSPSNRLSVPHDKNGKEIEQCNMSNYVTFLEENCSAFEIIGNTYENPELLTTPQGNKI